MTPDTVAASGRSPLVVLALSGLAPAFDKDAIAALEKEIGGKSDAVGTQMIVHPKVQASTRLVKRALLVMAQGLRMGSIDKAMADLDKRLYRAERGADVHMIRWACNASDDNTSASVSSSMSIDGQDIVVVPFFCGLDIQVPYAVKKGDKWESNGVFPCLLIRPHSKARNQRQWFAFPLGLCLLAEIEIYNKIAQGSTPPAPTIPVIPNRLQRNGTRRFEWTPSVSDYRPAREGDSDSRTRLGYYNGKAVELREHRSKLPPHKLNKGGELVKFHSGVFEYIEYATKIVVSYVGKPGEVKLEDEAAPTLDERMDIDPFACLGRTPMSLNPDKLQDLERRLLSSLGSPSNPAVVYAKALGIVRDGDPMELVVAQVTPLVKRAISDAKLTLDQTWRDLTRLVGSLSISLTLPQVLGDKSIEVVRARTSGEDVLATEIGKILGNWDWTSPVYLKLRQHVLEEVRKAAAHVDPPSDGGAPKPEGDAPPQPPTEGAGSTEGSEPTGGDDKKTT